jgi:hypothetical protein
MQDALRDCGSGSDATFQSAVTSQVSGFEQAALISIVDSGKITMPQYHSILTTLFHQTRSSPYSFAKAAINCDWRYAVAKEYLLQHAEEERTHRRWILEDLRNTGYSGPDPRDCFPHPTCEAYIAFNEHVAERMPVARLAIACVLEGIGAAFGLRYGRKLLALLQLGAGQASFFLSHGETDKRHVDELRDVISACELSPSDWAWMTHAATVAGQLYRAMYSHEAFVAFPLESRG